jgi:hypothetical protein
LAGQVQLKIAYLLMRWILGLAVLVFRGDQAKNAELLVLLCVPRIRSTALTSGVALPATWP